jgi:hypothetical protein
MKLTLVTDFDVRANWVTVLEFQQPTKIEMLYLTDSYPLYARAARIPLATNDRRRDVDSGHIQQCQCGTQFADLPSELS